VTVEFPRPAFPPRHAPALNIDFPPPRDLSSGSHPVSGREVANSVAPAEKVGRTVPSRMQASMSGHTVADDVWRSRTNSADPDVGRIEKDLCS
jgi:hypothetical protein